MHLKPEVILDDVPKFETWSNDELFEWAYCAHEQLVDQSETIAQLQRDFKDAMQANRELLKKLKGESDDWK